MPVRLALVGAGRWGRNYIKTIAALDGVQLVAVASRNSATAALVPAGCRIVEDWRLLLDASDVDGIVIASPPGTHADILIAAVERGKAVLVEKPAVMSRAAVSRVRAALVEHPAVILVGHTHLFHPAFRALCREAASLGPVRSIKSSAGNHGPYRRDASVLWDWAPHDLAMCLTLLPGPARLDNARRDEGQVIDGVVAERIVLDLTLATVPGERHRQHARRATSLVGGAVRQLHAGFSRFRGRQAREICARCGYRGGLGHSDRGRRGAAADPRGSRFCRKHQNAKPEPTQHRPRSRGCRADRRGGINAGCALTRGGFHRASRSGLRWRRSCLRRLSLLGGRSRRVLCRAACVIARVAGQHPLHIGGSRCLVTISPVTDHDELLSRGCFLRNRAGLLLGVFHNEELSGGSRNGDKRNKTEYARWCCPG